MIKLIRPLFALLALLCGSSFAADRPNILWGYHCPNNSKTDYNVANARKPWDESSNKAHYRNRAPGQPFFAVFNFTTSHESRVAPKAGKTIFRVPPEKIPLPPYHPDTPDIRRDWADYYDQMTLMDAQAGEALAELEQAGLADTTIVFYDADHGGAHIREFGHQGNARLRGTKADIWVGGHRVPFLVRWPGRMPAGAVSGNLVELTDLLATVAAIVGADLPAGAGSDSRSFLPALLEARPAKPTRDFSVHHSSQGVFAIRRGPWKLVPGHRGSGGFSQPKAIDPAQDGGPPGQLYNLETDPSETRNVYAEHPDVVERLTKLLKGIREKDA